MCVVAQQTLEKAELLQLYSIILYYGPHPESLVRSVNFLEFVTPKQNSGTVVALLRAN